MGISDKRTIKHMKDPVRGVFRVSSWHDVKPGTPPPPGNRIVGTISGPGIPDTTAERKLDRHHQPAQDLFGVIQDAIAQQHHAPGEPIVITSSTTMDMSRLPPQIADRVQAAMGEMFGAFGGMTGAAGAFDESAGGTFPPGTTRYGAPDRLRVQIDPLNPAKVVIDHPEAS